MSGSRPRDPELLDRDQDARHAYTAAVEREDEPSEPTTRPFSLRGVVPDPRMDVEVDWPLDLPITSALADLLESGARS